MLGITDQEIARLVAALDYSEPLTITAGPQDVRRACEQARKYGFRCVVSFPQYLGILVDELKDSGVLAMIAVGFPCGGQTTQVKCWEAKEGLERGATDLDMVMNISAFKQGEDARVSEDIAAVMDVAKPFKVPFKVIIEVGALSDAEITRASKLVADTGADFVKTSTGFGPGGVNAHIIGLIKEAVDDRIGIKASGGVASIEDGVNYMRMGASVVAMRQMAVDQLQEIGWRT